LWPGLFDAFPSRASAGGKAFGGNELQARLTVAQAVEAARAWEQGIVRSAAEADAGSVLGWGFPAHLGGVIGVIDHIGTTAFGKILEMLAERSGPRFLPPPRLTAAIAADAVYAPREIL
jgi:3-hydroxyacyl-CoA dehydrogenase/enoyl-CoA hydratase/3-hydroxybutyryl-CoA epimerase